MSKTNKCAITGSNGYLGKKLVLFFERQGWEVIKLTSKKDNNSSSLTFNLKDHENVNLEILKECSVLIHSAYDYTAKNIEESFYINVEGSRKIFEIASSLGVNKIINISSISAFNKAKSVYGRTKLEIEKAGKKFGVINLRAGLLFGDDSRMFDKIERICKKFPIIPLIGSGNFKLHLCHYEDFLNFILKIIEDSSCDTSKIYYCCSKEFITFRDLLKKISGNKLLIPIPKILIIFGLYFLELLRIRAPFTVDNLSGLISYSDEIDFTSTDKYQINFRLL